MVPLVKICGLSTPETLDAALSAGADMVGFVRFARSPRHVGLDLGADLSAQARGRAERVLLVVDADDRMLDAAVAAIDPDMIQLHGHETPERAADIRVRFGRRVMKALGIAETGDLARVPRYSGIAERVLLDAKPPRAAGLPGGNGQAFDWRLLAPASGSAAAAVASLDRTCLMLSGGLTPDNVGEAIRLTGLTAVDVSSGVESRPGEKDPARIAAFVAAARAAFAQRDRTRNVA